MYTQLKILFFALGLIILSQNVTYANECHGQNILSEKTCIGDELDVEENKLYQMINQYRIQNGLSSIPSAPSLNLVANRHVLDIAENSNYYARDGQNWLHGWSNCPYDANKGNTFSCMWEAPKRLGTPYPGFGYENFCGSPDAKYQHFIITAEYALKTWQKSMLHNEVILNQGRWKKYQWNAIGIGIYKGYAALWFGAEHDPLSSLEKK
jgi:hypothetical protein